MVEGRPGQQEVLALVLHIDRTSWNGRGCEGVRRGGLMRRGCFRAMNSVVGAHNPARPIPGQGAHRASLGRERLQLAEVFPLLSEGTLGENLLHLNKGIHRGTGRGRRVSHRAKVVGCNRPKVGSWLPARRCTGYS